MTRKMVLTILSILVLAGVIVGGVVAYAYLKPTAEASAPIQAVPLDTGSGEQEQKAPAPQPTATRAAASDGAKQDSKVQEDQGQAGMAGAVLFEISPERSQARFIINEILNGAPKTVVGATNQVSGQIEVNAQSPANTRVGVIEVNARTLTTDNEFRNRAIKNRILMTNDHEFITFTPTALASMPANVALNEPFKFQITGDLTIKGVTQTVTFEAEVTPVSETEMKGVASTVVKYADFGISIPNVPAVTGVDEEVRLEIEFTATTKTST